MAGSQGSFRWKSDTLTKNMKSFPKKWDRAVIAAVEFTATRGEAYMRTNARWRDQTSNARTGLHTVPTHEGKQHRILFAHSMNYGIWLETRFSGRYAIIMPSVLKNGQDLMRVLSKLLAGLGGIK